HDDRRARFLRVADTLLAAQEGLDQVLASLPPELVRAMKPRPAAQSSAARGLGSSLDLVIDEALAIDERRDRADAGAWTKARRLALTDRELEVAALVSRGLTNRQIAERLVLSERTIDAHLQRIRDRLGVRS